MEGGDSSRCYIWQDLPADLTSGSLPSTVSREIDELRASPILVPGVQSVSCALDIQHRC